MCCVVQTKFELKVSFCYDNFIPSPVLSSNNLQNLRDNFLRFTSYRAKENPVHLKFNINSYSRKLISKGKTYCSDLSIR